MTAFSLLYIFISLFNPSFSSHELRSLGEDVHLLADGTDASRWYIINDGVMGGLSRSQLRQQTETTLFFSGAVSLANNGGFASVRKQIANQPTKQVEVLSLRVKGDGKTYQARLAMNGQYRRASYAASFKTAKDKWEVIELSIADFTPQFRGRKLYGLPEFDPEQIEELGILIADKQEGDFYLEIDSIFLK